jgi:hypothetical protein
LGGAQGQGDGAGQDLINDDVSEVGLQAQGDRRLAECWSMEWCLPARDTVPVALTVQWISTGAPAVSCARTVGSVGARQGGALDAQSSQVGAGELGESSSSTWMLWCHRSILPVVVGMLQAVIGPFFFAAYE